MKKTHESKKRVGVFLKRYRIGIIASLLVIIAGTIFNVWYAYTSNAAYVQRQQVSSKELAKLDDQLKTIKDRKAAEAKAAEEAAKKAAEEKAAEEAKAAADKAKTAGNSGSTTIDAKTCNSSTSHINPASIDVVVNKKHCIQPLNYVPGDLTTSHGATLSSKAIAAYNQLFDAASAAGQPFYVTSSYRSYSNQVSTYNYWVNTSGQAGADTYSARPGYSEHQTGLAFDVAANGCTLDCFGTTSQYQWMQQHAADYGFIQRYYAGYSTITGYKAEEWHYRYVGVTVAKDMQAKGVKTLEQYWGISGGDY